MGGHALHALRRHPRVRGQVSLKLRPQRALQVPDWRWPGDQGLGGGSAGHVRRREEEADCSSSSYGDQGAGDIIPGGTTLYFEVELIDTEEGPTPVNVFKQIDIDADNALSRDEISSYLKQQVETMQNAGGEQGEEARKMMEDQDKLVEEIFAHEDKDKDGLISHEEFSDPSTTSCDTFFCDIAKSLPNSDILMCSYFHA